jgi:hypothetical protein
MVSHAKCPKESLYAIAYLVGKNLTNKSNRCGYGLVDIVSCRNMDMFMGSFDGHQTGLSITPSLVAPTT